MEGRVVCHACKDGDSFKVPFTMAFQPVVDVRSRAIYSYEALVRGTSGEGAGHVLSSVEPETRYSFDQACRVKAVELAARLNLPSSTRLNINFMPNAVYDPRACIQLTLRAANRVGLPLHQITFEITEDERIRDHAHLLGIIDEYRSHGFRIALDDFGAGYAGLNVLADLKPDYVKLDRAVLHGLDSDPRHRTITLGMVKVCQQLGVGVVAEGVETKEEFRVLADAGVDLFQGYLFARPALERLIPVAEIEFV